MRMLCGKTQHFALGLAPKILPRAAPAAKSDVPTSANIAPGRKSRPQTPNTSPDFKKHDFSETRLQNWQLRISATLVFSYLLLLSYFDSATPLSAILTLSHSAVSDLYSQPLVLSATCPQLLYSQLRRCRLPWLSTSLLCGWAKVRTSEVFQLNFLRSYC